MTNTSIYIFVYKHSVLKYTYGYDAPMEITLEITADKIFVWQDMYVHMK